MKTINKKCNTCGKHHTEIPVNARPSDMGLFWECDCKSTMFVMSDAVAQEMKLLKAKKEAA